MRLLVDASRRSSVVGPDLARAHRRIGHALASDVANHVSLDDVEIDHVAGPSTGVRLRPGMEPIFLVLLRGGLFLAEGLWECFPGSALVLHGKADDAVQSLPRMGRTIVIVDSVINSGTSVSAVVGQVSHLSPAKVLAVAIVGYRPTMQRLAHDHPSVDFIAARLSERSFVGTGPTDTGGRLFGTTTWE